MLNIQENVPLAPHTSFGIGGPARYFVEVKDKDELREALKYVLEKKLDFFVLGGGSNVLISDAGFAGMVIKFQDMRCEIQGTEIICGAGVMLAKIVALARNNFLTGLEWATGIPGTLGGAVRGNAGAFGESLSENIQEVNVMDFSADQMEDLEFKNLSNLECGFAYRSSIFKENSKLIIVSTKLVLKEAKKEVIEKKTQEIILKRNQKLPKGMKSAGSFFVNPKVGTEVLEIFEKKTGQKSLDGTVPAGWLIESMDLKGKRIGGAMVSEDHANCIVNTGNAKAEDVIILASLIKQKVRMEYAVQLMEELKLVGF